MYFGIHCLAIATVIATLLVSYYADSWSWWRERTTGTCSRKRYQILILSDNLINNICTEMGNNQKICWDLSTSLSGHLWVELSRMEWLTAGCWCFAVAWMTVLSLLCHFEIIYFVAQYNYINKFNDNKVKVLFSSLIFWIFSISTERQHTLTWVIFILNGKR